MAYTSEQTKKIELYREARVKYEAGSPIMSDSQFDILELEIKTFAPDEVKKVGANAKGQFKHWSPLLSLDKIKVYDNDNLPYDEFEKFISKFADNVLFEVSPKFDGNAINLKYSGGVLQQALSRSDESSGYDRKVKLMGIVPTVIPGVPAHVRMEVRGELVMPKDIFEAKYAKSDSNPTGSSNERNYVAGLLSSDDLRLSQIAELKFKAIELRIFEDPTSDKFDYADGSMAILKKFGFNSDEDVFTMNFTRYNWRDSIKHVYETFLEYRSKTNIRLDGFVIKANEKVRIEFGFNSHDPNWAIAIKFPPKDAITTLVSHEWKTGSTGKISPVAILDPIDLDGSVVTRATLHNWGHIVENQLFPGAQVLIAKSGDIIPRIYKVVVPSANAIPHPTECPSCKGIVEYFDVDKKILYCPNPDCPAKNSTRLAEGLKVLGIENVGPSTCEQLFEAGIISILDIFDPAKFNRQSLVASGAFQDGRSLDIVIDSVAALKECHLCHVIESLRITDVGTKLSKQLAKYYSKANYDVTGLNKSGWAVMTDVTSEPFKQLMRFLQILKDRGVNVVLEINDSNLITFEMTGEPPVEPGLATKSDWAALFERHGARATTLSKSTNYLVTNDYRSTTGKMEKAKKYGVKIITYEDFRNFLKA